MVASNAGTGMGAVHSCQVGTECTSRRSFGKNIRTFPVFILKNFFKQRQRARSLTTALQDDKFIKKQLEKRFYTLYKQACKKIWNSNDRLKPPFKSDLS